MPDQKSRAGARGPYAGGLARRERILDVTIQMLAEVGYHGLSMRDVARRVGISHPGVIYHFPTKEALLMAVIQRYEERVNFNLEEMESLDARELLERFMDLCQVFHDEPTKGEMECMLAAEASSELHPAHDHFVERDRRLNAIVRHAIEELRDEGVVYASVDVEQLAYSLVALGTGLHLLWLYNQDRYDPRSLLVQSLIRYIDLSKPAAVKLVLSMGLSSATVIGALERVKGKSVLQMIQDGDITVDKDFLRPYGLEGLPVELVQRVIDSGLLTAEHAASCSQRRGISLDLLAALVNAEIFDADDLRTVKDAGLVSDDVVAVLLAITASKAKSKKD